MKRLKRITVAVVVDEWEVGSYALRKIRNGMIEAAIEAANSNGTVEQITAKTGNIRRLK